jgi:hypothetical protein
MALQRLGAIIQEDYCLWSAIRIIAPLQRLGAILEGLGNFGTF